MRARTFISLLAVPCLVPLPGRGGSNAVAAPPSPAAAAPNHDFAARVRAGRRPRLTVVISIDQFRADYLRRFTDLFLPARQADGSVGGFRYLMTEGSYFLDARYDHMPTATGPGHAAILTGGAPDRTGIVANDWWDRAARAKVYCVDDPRQKVVGAGPGSTATPMGPLHLLSTTVGDEIKMATGGRSRVVTLSLKDRAAILLGGHMQDASVWFDPAGGGRWISSTAFCRDGELPAWAEAVNAEHVPDRMLGHDWEPSLPPAVLSERSLPLPNKVAAPPPYEIGPAFPHHVGAKKDKTDYQAFALTPAANAFVFTTAERAVVAEKLGQRGADTPDLLALNLATNDYVGHAFGPTSAEVADLTVQTDRQIADFLNFLRRTIPGGLEEVVIVVTADHGVAPIPEYLAAQGLDAGHLSAEQVYTAVERALSAAYGGGVPWVGKDTHGHTVGTYLDFNLYLSDEAIGRALAAGKAHARADIEATAAEAVALLPGVRACYTRSQLLHGPLPGDPITSRAATAGFYPPRSGDVIVVPDLLHDIDELDHAATHGSPYAYDSHVPILIAGPGIRPGVWAARVSPLDIAPTLCALLGIEYPAGCEGTPLSPALDDQSFYRAIPK